MHIYIRTYLHIYMHTYAHVGEAKFHMHHFRERCRESITERWKGRHDTSTGFSSRHSRRGFSFEGIQNFTQFSVEKSNTRFLFEHNNFSFIELISTQYAFFWLITTIFYVYLYICVYLLYTYWDMYIISYMYVHMYFSDYTSLFRFYL